MPKIKKKNNQKEKFILHLVYEIMVIVLSILACTNNSGVLGASLNNTINILFGSFFLLFIINLNIILPKFLFFNKKRVKTRHKVDYILIQLLLCLVIANTYYDAEVLNLSKEYENITSENTLFHIGLIGNFIFGNLYRLIGEVGFYMLSGSLIIFLIYYNIDIHSMDISRSKDVLKKIEKKQRIKKDISVEEKNKEEVLVKKVPKEKTNYLRPSLELLDPINDQTQIYDELKEYAMKNSENLVNALLNFKLQVRVSDISIGPNITRYELVPEPGVKVSKFATYNNDIAMAMAATSVRIEAPIYGKSAVGIEVSNHKSVKVTLREVYEDISNNAKNLLQVALGKDVSGEPVLCDIAQTPHLLVAGSTGSGKSVCINTLIASLLLKSTPQELKLILIDPKKVELTPFNGIDHLLTPVVTDPKKAALILQKMVFEMEHRYELFASTNCKNIDSYNNKCHEYSMQKLPYIVIIIDELADLMLIASKEVETSIARLTQMARACGIHLIIATQRPSTDVITGLIKSNIPSRISFAVSSSIDSRTILDKVGAEKLLGKGDMLLSLQGSNELKRIQGCFLSDNELDKIINSVSTQIDKKEDFEIFEQEILDIQTESNPELDEYYEEIKVDVVHLQKASASYIQRKYKVGYNRAMNIMQQLEENGVIDKSEGPKPRKVLLEIDDLEGE